MIPDNKQAPTVPASTSPEMVFDKYVAIALIVGLIAGFIIGNSVGANKAKNVDNDKENASSSMMIASSTLGANLMKADFSKNSNDIEVADQKAGSNVKVSKLSLDGTYWVAVRDNEGSVKTPYVLGGKKLAAGNYSDVTIFLPRATVAGKQYDVVLYKDSANFNYNGSLLVKDGNSIKASTFKAE